MSEKTEVLYNGECPVCSFEMDRYKARSENDSLPIRFDDLTGQDLARWNLTEDQAARRLHVRHQGEIYGGIPAFLVLWQQMPRMRWLAKIVGQPGVRQVASALYDFAVAPIIYHWHIKRRAKNDQ